MFFKIYLQKQMHKTAEMELPIVSWDYPFLYDLNFGKRWDHQFRLKKNIISRYLQNEIQEGPIHSFTVSSGNILPCFWTHKASPLGVDAEIGSWIPIGSPISYWNTIPFFCQISVLSCLLYQGAKQVPKPEWESIRWEKGMGKAGWGWKTGSFSFSIILNC